MKREIRLIVGLALLFFLSIFFSLTALSKLEAKIRIEDSAFDRTSVSRGAPRIHEENITLLIKTFARPGCLHRLLGAVRSRYTRMPILVADDSREPTTASIEGVSIVNLPWRSGCALGKNTLVQRVQTPYVIFMDDDMYPSPQLDFIAWVERLRELNVDLVSASVEDAVYGRLGVQEFIRQGKELHVLHNNISSLSPWRKRCISVNYALQIFASHTQLLKEVQWDNSLKTAEHEDFMLSLHKAGKSLATCTDFVVLHSRDENCIGSSEHAEGRREIKPYLAYTMRKWNLTSISYLAEKFTLTNNSADPVSFHFEEFHPVSSSHEHVALAAHALSLYNAPRIGWEQRALLRGWGDTRVRVKRFNLISAEAEAVLRTRWHRPKVYRDETGEGARNLTIRFRYVYSDTPLFYSFCHLAARAPFPRIAPTIYVVTAVYNVKAAFLRSLEQLKRATKLVPLHWMVVDFTSTDIGVKSELRDSTKDSLLDWTYISLPPPFCRSNGLNVAINSIVSPVDPLVFVLDAAMDYSDELLSKAGKYVARRETVWFPIYYGSDVNYWIHYGFGAFASYRSDFLRIGSFDAAKWGCKYGAEDMDLAGRYRSAGYVVWRTEERLVHYSHPRQQGYLADRNLWDRSSPSQPLLASTYRVWPPRESVQLLATRADLQSLAPEEITCHYTPRLNDTDVLHILTNKEQLLFHCQAKDVLHGVIESD